jgi:thiamine-phosphate pyrophosphorylase
MTIRNSTPGIPSLYAIVDVSVCRARGLDPRGVAQAFVAGGARLIQVRDKESGSAAALALAERVVAAAEPSGARVIVNDRPDLARLAGAAGVHVGQDDLPVDTARALLPPDAIVGTSTHTREQVDAALTTTATYVAVGPIYGTTTKDTGYGPRGLDLVRYASGRGKPVVAIGGVTLERVPALVAAGASSVAVISDLLAGDPAERVRLYLDALA